MKPSSKHLIDRLPHEPPMRLIDQAISASPSVAVCQTLVSDTLCSLFGDGRSMDSYACVEIIAQSAAVALASGREAEGQASFGMLVQIGSFRSRLERVPRGTSLLCEARVEQGLEGRVASVRGSVSTEGGALVCEAKLTLALAAS